MTMLNLSYKLSENTPFYEGLAKPRIEQIYDLREGHACNSFYFTASNHAGTHVDGPYHFNPAGRKIAETVQHGRFVLVPQMGHLFAAPLWPQLVSEIGQHAV